MELGKNHYLTSDKKIIDITKCSKEQLDLINDEINERVKASTSIINKKRLLIEKLENVQLEVDRQLYFKREKEENKKSISINKELINSI